MRSTFSLLFSYLFCFYSLFCSISYSDLISRYVYNRYDHEQHLDHQTVPFVLALVHEGRSRRLGPRSGEVGGVGAQTVGTATPEAKYLNKTVPLPLFFGVVLSESV